MNGKSLKLAAGLALVMVAGVVVASDEPLSAELTFSSDGGANFTKKAEVRKGGTIWVKISYVLKEKRPVYNKVLYSLLYSTNEDFASANCWRQRNRWGVDGWYQRLSKYYAGVKKKTGEFVYKLNLGARPEGTMGTSVKYDKEKKRYVAAPLPAAAPLAPGKHDFTATIYYRLNDKTKIEKKINFTVLVK